MSAFLSEVLILLVLTGLLAAVLTEVVRRYAIHARLLDRPGDRRSHHIDTPRGGGAAIVLAQLAAYAVMGWRYPDYAVQLACLAAGLLLVAGIGWWDDHRPLPVSWRLGVHSVASGLLAYLVWQGSGDVYRALFSGLLAVGLINVWNFMDGINGLAASQAILAALAFALWLPTPFMLLALLLAVGCAGFLPFNFPKARIFMGDVGSGALGYLLAASVAAGLCSTDLPWLLWLVPLGVFLVDAGCTLLMRMRQGDTWWQPHTRHLYQVYVRQGHSHTVVTLAYALYGAFGIIMLALCLWWVPHWVNLLVTAWGVCTSLLWRILRSTSIGWNFGMLQKR